MKAIRNGVLILFFLSHSSPFLVPAQSIELYSQVFSPESAFDNQRVSCMHQDSKGLFWLGTNSGLYMYDGHSVYHFQHHANDVKSLVNNNITAILEDTEANLWIGTESGLSHWDRGSGTFTSLFINNRVADLLLSSDEKVLVAIGEHGVIRFDPGKLGVEAVEAFPLLGKGFVVESLEETGKGIFWLATRNGLLKIDKSGDTLQKTRVTTSLNVLAASKNGDYLCAGTSEGELTIFDLNDSSRLVQRYSLLEKGSRNFIRTISFDEQSGIWAGTTSGLFVKPAAGSKGDFKKVNDLENGLLSNDIYSVYTGPHGTTWVGSLRGVNCLKKRTVTISTLSVRPPDYTLLNQQIRSVHYDRFGYLWVGTQNDGVFRFNKQMNSVQKIPVPGTKVNAFLESHSGELFIATDNQLWELDYTGQLKFREKDFQLRYQGSTAVKAIAEPEPGEIWFGTWKEGLKLLQGDRIMVPALMQEINEKWDQLHIADLMEDTNGNVWVATRGQGLLKISLKENDFEIYRFGAAEEEVTYGILCLMEDRYGNVWAGTRGGGVFFFEKGKQDYRQFTMRDGLPFNVVCAISEDKNGHVWLSTEKGMARYVPERSLPFVYFDKIDLLANKRFKFNSVAGSPAGDLFFGSINGISRIEPNRMSDNETVAHAALRNMTILGEEDWENNLLLPIPDAGEIQLDSRENSFQLNFASHDYASLNSINYAYRLKGYDEDFTISKPGERQAVYRDLPSGAYTFELIASNGKGRWAADPERYAIVIAAPAWLSWPALTGYALAIVLLSAGAFVVLKRRRRWNLLRSREEIRSGNARKITLEPSSINPESADDQFIKKVTVLLEERVADPMFTMEELIMETGMSRATFYRKIKELFDDTPSNLIRTFRLKRAAQLLELQKFKVAEIAYMTGFRDPKYFSQCFFKEYNCVPSQYNESLSERA